MDERTGQWITPDERTMALLAHVLQLVGGFIGPLVIYLVKRGQSRFVAFHALQALLWQVLVFAINMVVMVVWMATVFGAIASSGALQSRQAGPPTQMFAAMAIIGPFSLCLFAVNVTLAIVYGLKANRGEWAEYPLLGSIARRWSGA